MRFANVEQTRQQLAQLEQWQQCEEELMFDGELKQDWEPEDEENQ